MTFLSPRRTQSGASRRNQNDFTEENAKAQRQKSAGYLECSVHIASIAVYLLRAHQLAGDFLKVDSQKFIDEFARFAVIHLNRRVLHQIGR